MPELVIEQRRQNVGGFLYGRILPSDERCMVGPFIFLDHMGPAFIGRELDILPHPHIGLAAVTYVFTGEIIHRDSVGSEQPIRPGDVNWMTAGRGITHSERFSKSRTEGESLHCIQGWVALPDMHEETNPSFVHFNVGTLPVSDEGGVWTRVIAGEAYGLMSPVRPHSRLFLAHHVLQPEATLRLPADYQERAVYIVSGAVESDGDSFGPRRMLVFANGAGATVRAVGETVLMALGGEPVGPRFVEWNFVSSSRERIKRAKQEWGEGRTKLPDLDNEDFIPLPDEPEASLPPR